MSDFALTWAHSFAILSGSIGLIVAIIGAFIPRDALFKAGLLYATLGSFVLGLINLFMR